MQIEKNVPLPHSRANERYPFNYMVVGDSIFFKDEDGSGPACTAARSYNYRNKEKKFVCRTVDGGARIWRVE